MSLAKTIEEHSCSPLESFVRDYVESIGGAWDVVEPEVYDLLVPPAGGSESALDRELFRITFDPEAVPEHAGSQLASFGAPLIDRWLEDAMRRGRAANLYLVGLNTAPHDLPGRIRRALTIAPQLELQIERVRPLDFPQAVFWFQATFVSDQKEQEIVPVAFDLHYLRQTRHLEKLLDWGRLAERPSERLIEARRSAVAAAYPIARERVQRTLAAIANVRTRELDERTERQVSRIAQYYADLRSEMIEQRHRADKRSDAAVDLTSFDRRLDALEREQQLRIAELRQKNSLSIELRLINLLVVHQPKVLVKVKLVAAIPHPTSAPNARRVLDVPITRPPAELELVWDPLVESLEAPPCPACQRPSYSLAILRSGTAGCSECSLAAQKQGRRG